MAGIVGSAWIGVAATSCGQLGARLAQAHDVAARNADTAASTLDACAAAWERARDLYQEARRLADEAIREERAGYATPLRVRAAALATQAVDDFQRAARDAAAVLDAHARAPAPIPPSAVRHRHQGRPWYRNVLGWLGDRGEDLADAGRSLLNFGGYAATHPGETAGIGLDAAGMTVGMLGIAAGLGGEVGGTALAMTGIGAPVAVPVGLASAGLVFTGATVTGVSALKANQDLHTMWAEANSEGSGGGPEASSVGSPAGMGSDANQLLGSARQVGGRFPRTAGPNEVLVRRGSDGATTHYEVYGEDGLPLKRVDLTGSPHGGVETPHVVEFERHVNPNTGEVFLKPGRVRPARPDEVPTP